MLATALWPGVMAWRGLCWAGPEIEFFFTTSAFLAAKAMMCVRTSKWDWWGLGRLVSVLPKTRCGAGKPCGGTGCGVPPRETVSQGI